jgi:tetratricopeptide (TPR) repeat protein
MFWILFAGICYMCYRFNPTEESFKAFSRPQKTWLSRLLPTGKVKYDSYLFFSTVTWGGKTYIGILNNWYIYSENNSRAGRNDDALNEIRIDEKEAEGLLNEAIKLKSAKDYSGAYQKYCRAAQVYAKSDNKFDHLEAGRIYEEAFKIASDPDKIECLQKAVTFYAGDFSRSARVYDKLGEILSKTFRTKEASEAYFNAYDTFKANNDERYLSCLLRKADVECLNMHNDALKTYTLYLRENQQIKIWDLKLAVFNMAFCKLQVSLNGPEWHSDFRKWFNETLAEHGSLHQELEFRFLSDLVKSCGNNDRQEFDSLVHNFTKIKPLDKWKMDIINNLKCKINENSLT